MSAPNCPLLAVDIITFMRGEEDRPFIVLIKRKNPPYGWALPGGFVDKGETVENAAARELKEETSLDAGPIRLFGVYSDPARDPRGHTVSVTFITSAQGEPKAMDDAAEIALFDIYHLPDLAFDHAKIIADCIKYFSDKGIF